MISSIWRIQVCNILKIFKFEKLKLKMQWLHRCWLHWMIKPWISIDIFCVFCWIKRMKRQCQWSVFKWERKRNVENVRKKIHRNNFSHLENGKTNGDANDNSKVLLQSVQNCISTAFLVCIFDETVIIFMTTAARRR